MNKHTPREYIEARIIKDALVLETYNISVLLSKRDEVSEDDWIDYMSDFRCNGLFSGLPSKNNSRHYEVDFVYDFIFDEPIGWDYWHGGGKHGEPESVDWIDSAEFLKITHVETVLKYRLARTNNNY